MSKTEPTPCSTERDHIYVGHAPSFWRWSPNYEDVADAFKEEDITIMHKRGREYVLDLSTDERVIENQEACINRRYDCGHVAYGPSRRLPSECPLSGKTEQED